MMMSHFGRIVSVPHHHAAVTPEPDEGLHTWQHMTRTLAHYERQEQIGEGTYGQVYRALCRDTGRTVALKKMRIHHGGYWGMPLQLIREIKILKRLRHDNLLQMIEVVTSKGVEHLDDDDPPMKKNETKSSDRTADARESYKGNLFLVLDYVPHDLTGLMDIAFSFSEVQIKCIMQQLLRAIAYMHEQKYVHRDIKSSNILITERFQLKLADFGLARCIEPQILDQVHDRTSTSLELTNKVITLWYRPPEILLGATQYGGAVDVWSAGCILAELLLGKPLFAGKTEIDQLQLIIDLMGTPSSDTWEYLSTLKRMRSGEVTFDKVRQPRLRDKYSHKMPASALNLLEKLLEWDPRKRLTASNALKNRYFLTQPIPPDNPAELGALPAGGHFHEFQTKKKRREAKAEAEKAKEDALLNGASEEEAKAEFDRVYKGLIQKVAEEGIPPEPKMPVGPEPPVPESKPDEVPAILEPDRRERPKEEEAVGSKRRLDEEDEERRKRRRREDKDDHEQRPRSRSKEDRERKRDSLHSDAASMRSPEERRRDRSRSQDRRTGGNGDRNRGSPMHRSRGKRGKKNRHRGGDKSGRNRESEVIFDEGPRRERTANDEPVRLVEGGAPREREQGEVERSDRDAGSRRWRDRDGGKQPRGDRDSDGQRRSSDQSRSRDSRSDRKRHGRDRERGRDNRSRGRDDRERPREDRGHGRDDREREDRGHGRDDRERPRDDRGPGKDNRDRPRDNRDPGRGNRDRPRENLVRDDRYPEHRGPGRDDRDRPRDDRGPYGPPPGDFGPRPPSGRAGPGPNDLRHYGRSTGDRGREPGFREDPYGPSQPSRFRDDRR